MFCSTRIYQSQLFRTIAFSLNIKFVFPTTLMGTAETPFVLSPLVFCLFITPCITSSYYLINTYNIIYGVELTSYYHGLNTILQQLNNTVLSLAFEYSVVTGQQIVLSWYSVVLSMCGFACESVAVYSVYIKVNLSSFFMCLFVWYYVLRF